MVGETPFGIAHIRAVLRSLPAKIDTNLNYSEFCYQQLIKQILIRDGYKVQQEVHCTFTIETFVIGGGRIDLMVEIADCIIIIELKANLWGNKSKSKAMCQIKRYLKHYETSKVKLGLLVMYNCNGKDVSLFDVMAPT